MRQKLFVVISLMGALSVFSACDIPETDYRDFLNASGTVLRMDGSTPVSNLQLDRYEWIVSYKDGSTVGVPFDSAVNPAAAFITGADGKFAFSSTELALESGNLAEYCTDVCVASDLGMEEVCDYWATDYEEYCWIDENGYEWCDTESYTYCASSHYEYYEYCTAWGQDCDYYYPARSTSDITVAYSEISYKDGLTAFTTQSQAVTYPEAALQSTTTKVGKKDSIIDSTWTQNDLFITPLSSSTSKMASTKSNLPGFRVKRARKPVATKLGRTHEPAVRIKSDQLSQLTAEQKLKLEMTRINCGAISKVSK